MPFNNQCICPVFPAHCFHARLVRSSLFADSLEDLPEGISPGIAVDKKKLWAKPDSDPWSWKRISDEVVKEIRSSS